MTSSMRDYRAARCVNGRLIATYLGFIDIYKKNKKKSQPKSTQHLCRGITSFLLTSFEGLIAIKWHVRRRWMLICTVYNGAVIIEILIKYSGNVLTTVKIS